MAVDIGMDHGRLTDVRIVLMGLLGMVPVRLRDQIEEEVHDRVAGCIRYQRRDSTHVLRCWVTNPSHSRTPTNFSSSRDFRTFGLQPGNLIVPGRPSCNV